MNEILVKDAVYLAIGNSLYDIQGIDFEHWFRQHLQHDLGVTVPGCVQPWGPAPRCNLGQCCRRGQILRRRVAWLIGQYVDMVKQPFCLEIYRVLATLLVDQDFVVKFSACVALHAHIDTVEFVPDTFLPFFENILTALYAMLAVAAVCPWALTRT